MGVDSRRLLLIDDSEIALAYAESVLTDAGFEVRAVGSLRTFQTVLSSWRPHLIVTDLYMPEMNGAELFVQLAGRWPKLKVLFVSGYGDETIAPHGVLAPGVPFLHKPFSIRGLARKVREVLDR